MSFFNQKMGKTQIQNKEIKAIKFAEAMKERRIAKTIKANQKINPKKGERRIPLV